MTKLTRKPVAQECKACTKMKMCHMYVLQDGTTAFICYNCRYGISRIRASRVTRSEHRQTEAIKAFNQARNKALLEGPDALLQHMRDRKLPIPSNRLALEVTYHKTVTGVASLPHDFRLTSKKWLDARGLHSWDDGDLK